MTRARRNRYRPVDTALSALRWAEGRRDGEEAGTPTRSRYEEEVRRLRDEYEARSAEARSPANQRPSPLADQRAPVGAHASPGARPVAAPAGRSPASASPSSAPAGTSPASARTSPAAPALRAGADGSPAPAAEA